jgi:uncharacterized membrane protein YuzA (DUF378 family)
MVNNLSPKALPISQDFEVRPPVSEKGFTVTDSDWSYLHKKISQISTGEIGYHTAGSVALGVAGSALIGAITLPESTKLYGMQSSLLCWFLFGLFGICGLMAFLFSREQRKFTVRSKNDALEEMSRIEKRCNPIHIENQTEDGT